MHLNKVRSIFILLSISTAPTANAQYSIGSWKDHLPYNNAFSICHYSNNIYIATENGLFIKESEDNSIRKLNKTTGLSDVGISAVENNENHLVIGYLNGNIDVIENRDIYIIFRYLKMKPYWVRKRSITLIFIMRLPICPVPLAFLK